MSGPNDKQRKTAADYSSFAQESYKLKLCFEACNALFSSANNRLQGLPL